jgi:1-deoxy-D-xylulose-5-phosphate reductoisomerase
MRDKQPAGITILGATGSIGVSTLDVVSRYPDRFRVVALTAYSDVDTLAAQCRQFLPQYAVMADPAAAEQLEQRLGDVVPDVHVLAGSDALVEVAGLPGVDYVMAAIVGAAGLLPSLEAARKGKHVLLANKEALVMSGALFMQAVRDHNAVDGYTAGTAPPGVSSITLTASGGPFRDTPVSKLASVTPEQACAHPNWNMGRKISVDSATMMNKGLEVIEAGWLFDLPVENIRVVLHPQSILHSMVEYTDSSVLAQLGNPDMRIPISHALGWPDRIVSGAEPLDIAVIGQLQFSDPDLKRFPCLALAFDALRAGGTAPAILNAANEVAVQAFLCRQLAFTDIPRTIDYVMDHCDVQDAGSLDAVLGADARAREWATGYIKSASGRVVGT